MKHLETLWAPWRVEYFQEPKKKDFLSEAAESSDDAAHLIVTRRKNAFLILNKYPYATGHLMAVPYRKTSQMSDLAEAEIMDLWELVLYAQKILTQVVCAEGFNLGINIGEAGGAGIDGHLHFHIVPRWSNDQNFMPMLSGTRIIPEGLKPLYERLMEYQNVYAS
ncbi:MAG: HIT family protein [Chthoniobacterales bacterium]